MDQDRFVRIASFAEIISAIAIVLSVIYAANEFSKSETLTASDADDLLFTRGQDHMMVLVQVPDLAEIVIKAIESPEQLTSAERLRYITYEHSFLDTWEMGWNYYQRGIIAEKDWRTWDDWYAGELAAKPAFAWTDNRHNFSGAFLGHVEERLAAARATSTKLQ